MGDVLSTASANFGDLASSISFPPTSSFNFSSFNPSLSLPTLSAPSSQSSWHVLLWDTDCLFCSVFKPITSWTVVGRSLKDKHEWWRGNWGARKRKQTRRKWQQQQMYQYQRQITDSANTFHSLPTYDETSRGGYKTYYYEAPIPRPEQVLVNKRHVEKRGLISRERTKNILESAKSILQLAVKLLELWNNIRKAREKKEA